MKAQEPLRGEAAWKAARKEIAAKNDAVCAQAREDRASRNAQISARRRAEEIADRAHAENAHLNRIG
jgi:hypothetical protein